VLLLLGAVPAWPYSRGWGYGPSGGLGLLLVVLRAPAGRVAAMVAAYIGSAYWFTASTSFANPAAAFGRMFSDSFAGIAPASVPGFVVAELFGAALALVADRQLGPTGDGAGPQKPAPAAAQRIAPR
jgi:glycerol uptake facilitator-like aquaporin